MYHRALSRSSAHRQALLRNLTTSLLEHESITTTYAKAKEVQPFIEKLITLGKRDTPTSREKARSYIFSDTTSLAKLFSLKTRYASRQGGYTRVLRCEPLKSDMAESAIICLVDGPRDVRFAMTARALLRQEKEGLPMNELTAKNVQKVTKFRAGGVEELTRAVKELEREQVEDQRREKSAERGGVSFKYTNELPRKHWKFREDVGPGYVVKRAIKEREFEDLDNPIPKKTFRGKASKARMRK